MKILYINSYKIQFKPWFKLNHNYTENTLLNYKKCIS